MFQYYLVHSDIIAVLADSYCTIGIAYENDDMCDGLY